MTLQEHLNACYEARAGLRTSPAESVFAAALKDDDKLYAEAAAKKDSLIDLICKRCFISRTHRDILTAALASREM